MTVYDSLKSKLRQDPKTWLVTGVAGFIGSNLLETLLQLDQRVVGLDNFSTGKTHNLEEVKQLVTPQQWRNFTFVDGDICDLKICHSACRGIDYILHEAALCSVPRSLDDPLGANASNITGFVNMLVAARDQKVARFVYAASSSTYGDDPSLPKVEDKIGRPLSPYALTKYVNELYAEVFGRCYGLQTVGLRYFNVFGPRQDPDGAYAAVVPRWVASMLKKQPTYINGDGETTRDFCYIANVVQANLLAATTPNPDAVGQVFNVALNSRTSLNQLFHMLRERLLPAFPHLQSYQPIYQDFRAGDVRHSQADISKARRLLGYEPTHTVADGLTDALEWYKQNVR
jgi:UDP-N-acetylglucosamine 4-epimerase